MPFTNLLTMINILDRLADRQDGQDSHAECSINPVNCWNGGGHLQQFNIMLCKCSFHCESYVMS